MKQEKILSKGYTITIESWENDADYYNTKKVVVDTVDKVNGIMEMLELCRDRYTGPYIGNSSDPINREQRQACITIIRNNPALIEGYSEPDETIDDLTDEDCLDIFNDWNYELLGSSEWYWSRVFDKATVTYSPIDVYADVPEYKKPDLKSTYPELFL